MVPSKLRRAAHRLILSMGKADAKRRKRIGSATDWNGLIAAFIYDKTSSVFKYVGQEYEEGDSEGDSDSCDDQRCASCGCQLESHEGLHFADEDYAEHLARRFEQKQALKKHLLEKHNVSWPPTLPPQQRRITLVVEGAYTVMPIHFNIQNTSILGKIFERYCKDRSCQARDVQFEHRGKIIDWHSSASENGILDKDMLKCVRVPVPVAVPHPLVPFTPVSHEADESDPKRMREGQ